MRNYAMKISKKEGGIYVEVGTVTVFYPLLEELGINVKPSKFVSIDKDGKEIDSTEANGAAFPVYESESIQYVFDSVFAAVKATARNRLVSGTAELKPDNKIAETVEELLAAGERSGEALKQRREYFTNFKAWLATLGKSAGYVQGMYDIVSNVKNIPYQSEARKAAVSALVVQHAASLDAESQAKWERVMTQIDEACSSADPLLE